MESEGKVDVRNSGPAERVNGRLVGLDVDVSDIVFSKEAPDTWKPR